MYPMKRMNFSDRLVMLLNLMVSIIEIDVLKRFNERTDLNLNGEEVVKAFDTSLD